MTNTPMRISQRGIDLIKQFEGLRHEVYEDSGGNKTAGYGHRTTLPIGTHVSTATIDKWLRMDIAGVEWCVNTLIEVGLEQEEFDALCSLVFNIGCTAFYKSTLRSVINGHKAGSITAEWLKWDHIDHKESFGLKKRRLAEIDYFTKENGPTG